MKKYIIPLSIIIVGLLVILIIAKKNEFVIEEVDISNITNEITTDGGSILYTGELTKDVKSKLKDIYDTYKITCYYSNITLNEINDLIDDYELSTENENIYIIFMNGEIVDIVNIDDDTTITEKIEKYLYNKIPASEVYYKVLSTADEYIKKVNSKKYTIAVFGKSDCTYCDLYLPVINTIAKDYNLDIYYFDKDTYDEDEYEEIMELDFTIPAKCTTTGYSTTMSQSFPKPMTIITKGGEFVDCIRGYVTENDVLKVFKEYGIVKE